MIEIIGLILIVIVSLCVIYCSHLNRVNHTLRWRLNQHIKTEMQLNKVLAYHGVTVGDILRTQNPREAKRRADRRKDIFESTPSDDSTLLGPGSWNYSRH